MELSQDMKQEKDIALWIKDPYRGYRKPDGFCDMVEKKIFINEEHWESINMWQRQELLYHELGHCLLRLKDKTGYSIMNPLVSTMYHVKEDGSNWNELVEELQLSVKAAR